MEMRVIRQLKFRLHPFRIDQYPIAAGSDKRNGFPGFCDAREIKSIIICTNGQDVLLQPGR